jgi:hypothetical protein
MSLSSRRELEITREKLRRIEEKYLALKVQPADDAHVRELSLRSLKTVINRLKEEITRFEVRALPAGEDMSEKDHPE